MQKQLKIMFVLVFLILITPITSASAETASNEITATTNKSSYQPGEKIIITGTVKNVVEGHPVTILIRNPIQNVYNVGQVDLQGNVFVHDLVISNDSKPGIYIVEIKHGSHSAELQFFVNTGLVQTIFVGGSSIKVRGDEIGLIKYKNVRVSTQDNSITIDLDIATVSDNSIIQEFEIPKEVIDAPGQSLLVEVDGVVLNCSETETNTARILDCFIPSNARELKITGTSVIPEFGSIAVIILIVGITSIVVLSTRIKLRQPFY